MPRAVRAFACEWGCGRNVTTKRTGMVSHESRCRKNPDAKCCPTCEYNFTEPPEPHDWATGYLGTAGGHYCDIEKLPDGKIMMSECPHWAPKKGLTPCHPTK